MDRGVMQMNKSISMRTGDFVEFKHLMPDGFEGKLFLTDSLDNYGDRCEISPRGMLARLSTSRCEDEGDNILFLGYLSYQGNLIIHAVDTQGNRLDHQYELFFEEDTLKTLRCLRTGVQEEFKSYDHVGSSPFYRQTYSVAKGMGVLQFYSRGEIKTVDTDDIEYVQFLAVIQGLVESLGVDYGIHADTPTLEDRFSLLTFTKDQEDIVDRIIRQMRCELLKDNIFDHKGDSSGYIIRISKAFIEGHNYWSVEIRLADSYRLTED